MPGVTKQNQIERARQNRKRVLPLKRRFTKAGVHPFDEIEWRMHKVLVRGSNGSKEERELEFPAFWSDNAASIAGSKYFRGRIGSPERETSVRSMISRVVSVIRAWGRDSGYFSADTEAEIFADELTHILLHQKAAFNSPVWFNVGVEDPPQCSACQPYRALVSTPVGFYPIGKIVEENLIGLPVYDSRGITQVVAVKNNGIKKVYKVALRNGTYIEATGDHQVRAVHERRTTPQWFRVDELKTGMRLHLYPHREISERLDNSSLFSGTNRYSEIGGETLTRTISIAGVGSSSLEISKAALAGWLQADGFVGQYHTGTNNSLTIEFVAVTEEERQWIESHLNVVFPNVHRKIRITKTKAGTPITRVRLYGEVLRAFVDTYELLARRNAIRVPAILWRSSPAVIEAYVKSVFQGEGFVRINNTSIHVAIDTISEGWMHDIQLLLYGLGIYSRIRRKKEPRVNRGDLYEVDISAGSERRKFADRIGFISASKQEKLLRSLEAPNQKNIPDLREEEIVEIKDLGEEVVYDIQTSSGEYLSNNVVVHNCFILAVDDNMESILDWIYTEGMIFKRGSGAGVNLSPLRSSMETLSRGGVSSGPVSFMRGADSVAGMIASGGSTRRAAKMVVLNIDHPDIMRFIRCKAEEEKKVHALMETGYDMYDLNNPAWNSIQYQNANNSVRVTDEFMEAVERDETFTTKFVGTDKPAQEYRARDLMHAIAEAAWESGDPGMQYDTIINKWHTCPNTGRINASNPCFTGDALIYTDKGLLAFEELYKRANTGEAIRVFTHNATRKDTPQDSLSSSRPAQIMMTGVNDVYRLIFSNGMEVRATKNHRFFTKNRGMVAAEDLRSDDQVMISTLPVLFERSSLSFSLDEAALFASGWEGRNTKRYRPVTLPRAWSVPFAHYIGYLVGDGSISLARDSNHRLSNASVVFGAKEESEELAPQFTELFRGWGVTDWQELTMPNGTLQLRINRTPVVRMFQQLGVSERRAPLKVVPRAIFQTPQSIQAAFLRGLFTADGCVYDGKKHRYVGLGSASKELLLGAQQLLLAQGIFSRIYNIRKSAVSYSTFEYIRKDGTNITYKNNPSYDLRISGPSIARFKEHIGFLTTRKQVKLEKLAAEHEFYDIEHGAVQLREMKHEGAEFTYNLTESKNHSYIANGFVVANCSEYMHLDNSACNLASINVIKYLNPDGSFNIRDFIHTVDILILAQDILVGGSSYPTEKIGENARNYRELGLGYANLGALLMTWGFPYDSDEARHTASAITALMTGEAYRYSAEIAKKMGAYAGYEINKEPQLRVVSMHRAEFDRVREDRVQDTAIYKAAQKAWDDAVFLGKKYGVRNSQVTVIAPTGTIALMMDCATTGIEPEFALVKTKNLVGGGTMRFVNTAVPDALKNLGYSDAERDLIVAHIESQGTIEGAPALKDEHVAVFDSAVRPANGVRSIHWQGHVKMVAAVQPFISGAISKTFNMSADTSVDEIMKAYIMGWKLGLKAFAVYRDGSKAAQPLVTASGKGGVKKEQKPFRRKLPATRPSETHKFSIAGHEGYLTYSMYENRDLAEIFITMSKQGSTLAGLLDAFAISVSIALQHGVPLKTLARKFVYGRFEPAGFTENSDIQVATSITDYIFRYLSLRFLSSSDLDDIGVKGAPKEVPAAVEIKEMKAVVASEVMIKAPVVAEAIGSKVVFADSVCRECGGMLVQTGSCKTCFQCGTSTGGC